MVLGKVRILVLGNAGDTALTAKRRLPHPFHAFYLLPNS